MKYLLDLFDWLEDFVGGLLLAALKPYVFEGEHQAIARRLFFWMFGRYVPAHWLDGLWLTETK